MMQRVEDSKDSSTFVNPKFKRGRTRLRLVPYKIAGRRANVSLLAGSPHPGDRGEIVNDDCICDSNYIDEWFGRKALKLIAEAPDVVHGKISPNGDPATLIVLKFKFQSLAIGRRFKSARITVTFSDTRDDSVPIVENKNDDSVPATGKKKGPSTLAVERIVPDGTWALDQSVETEDRTNAANLNGISAPGFTINAGFQHQHHEVGQKTDKATVSGTPSIDDSRRHRHCINGNNNVVIWSLAENPFTKQGIPTLLEGAILLKRDPTMPEKEFEVLVEIEAVVDWKTNFSNIIHKTPINQLITFDPKQDSEGKNYMVNKLGAENLMALQRIISSLPMSVPGTPVKERKDHSMSEPCALANINGMVNVTNVTVIGGKMMSNGPGITVSESVLPRCQSA
jgi:hypothetical protein